MRELDRRVAEALAKQPATPEEIIRWVAKLYVSGLLDSVPGARDACLSVAEVASRFTFTPEPMDVSSIIKEAA